MEWTNFERDKVPEECQNICIPDGIHMTGKNPIRDDFTKEDELECDIQELALDKRFAGQSSPFFKLRQ